MKVSVSSNALCFVLGWIEAMPLFKLTGLLPSIEMKQCIAQIKSDMSEAEFVASSGDVENALQSESARLLTENARLRKQFEGATMDINCLKIHSSQIESENLMLRAGEAQLRKELADIIVAKGKLESENITLRSVEVQLRKKLKEVNAQLDKLRMEPIQVGQQEKWTARVLAILDRIIADTETFGDDFGMSHVAKFAREAKMLIAGVTEKGSEKNDDIRPNRTIRLMVESNHGPDVGSNGRAKLGYTVVATKRSTMPIEQWTTADPTQRIRELPPMPSLAHLSHTLMEYAPLDLRHALDVERGIRAVLRACGLEASE